MDDLALFMPLAAYASGMDGRKLNSLLATGPQ
jgi:hypothetical protein